MTNRLQLTALTLAITAVACQAPDSRSAAIQARLETVQQHTDTRNTLKNTVRIRAQPCDGLPTGTGFLLDSATAATNRHVIEGGTTITVTTWDGRDHAADARLYAAEADLTILAPRSSDGAAGTTEITTSTPQIGDHIAVLGHRGAGAASLRYGSILERPKGGEQGHNTDIMRIGVEIGPGDSGAPVVETTTGKLVGIIFAYDESTGDGLLIPAVALEGAFTPSEEATPCTDPENEGGVGSDIATHPTSASPKS